MTPPATSNPYKRSPLSPGEIISHAVWLYYRFSLSHRDVEELLFERGIVVPYEAIRKWCRKFGQVYANKLRRRRPRPGDKWHLDELLSHNDNEPVQAAQIRPPSGRMNILTRQDRHRRRMLPRVTL